MTRTSKLLPLMLVAVLASSLGAGQAWAEDEEPGLEPGADESYADRDWLERGPRGRHGHHRDAMRGSGLRREGRGPRRMGPAGPGIDRLHLVLRGLDLSESQRLEIRAILDQERDQAQAQHERVSALGAELEEQIENDPRDEEAVRAKATAVAFERVEMTVMRARQMSRIRDLLTPEQLSRLETMKDRRKEFREERRERFEHHRKPRSGS